MPPRWLRQKLLSGSDTGKVDRAQVLEEWFDGEKADGCRCLAELIDAWLSILAVLHAHAPPDVCHGSPELLNGFQEHFQSLSSIDAIVPHRVKICHFGLAEIEVPCRSNVIQRSSAERSKAIIS
jgi:hypothetical protein